MLCSRPQWTPVFSSLCHLVQSNAWPVLRQVRARREFSSCALTFFLSSWWWQTDGHTKKGMVFNIFLPSATNVNMALWEYMITHVSRRWYTACLTGDKGRGCTCNLFVYSRCLDSSTPWHSEFSQSYLFTIKVTLFLSGMESKMCIRCLSFGSRCVLQEVCA